MIETTRDRKAIDERLTAWYGQLVTVHYIADGIELQVQGILQYSKADALHGGKLWCHVETTGKLTRSIFNFLWGAVKWVFDEPPMIGLSKQVYTPLGVAQYYYKENPDLWREYIAHRSVNSVVYDTEGKEWLAYAAARAFDTEEDAQKWLEIVPFSCALLSQVVVDHPEIAS